MTACKNTEHSGLETRPTALIEINIQIRTIKAIAAVGTGHFAILLVHLVAAAVTDIGPLFAPGNRLEKRQVKLAHIVLAESLDLMDGDFRIPF